MPGMTRRSLLLLVLVLFGLGGADAEAGKKSKKKEKYRFELAGVKAGAGVEGQVAADALRLLEAEVKKAFETHPQMVTDMSSAPDPDADPKGYAKWLKKKKIKGAFKVDVDLTLYVEETEDSPQGEGAKRLVVRLELHMFGERIPERKMGFEGVGSATVKQDVGKKVRPKDREFTIQSAIELAVADAMEESLHKLSLPPAKPMKK
jgi:hypothetical protein